MALGGPLPGQGPSTLRLPLREGAVQPGPGVADGVDIRHAWRLDAIAGQ